MNERLPDEEFFTDQRKPAGQLLRPQRFDESLARRGWRLLVDISDEFEVLVRNAGAGEYLAGVGCHKVNGLPLCHQRIVAQRALEIGSLVPLPGLKAKQALVLLVEVAYKLFAVRIDYPRVGKQREEDSRDIGTFYQGFSLFCRGNALLANVYGALRGALE